MSSEVEICNLALSLLGQKGIISLLSPTNKKEEMCALHYAPARDAVVSERTWTWATFRAKRESTIQDEWNTGYVYPMEPEWLNVKRCYSDVTGFMSTQEGAGRPQTEWRKEDVGIIAKPSTLYIWGIKQVTETNKFSALFVQAIAARLAVNMCIALTENRSLLGDMWTLYDQNLAAAAAEDGSQGRSEVITASRLINARAG